MNENKLDHTLDNSLAGKIIISSPAIEDNRFYKSVILITDHNKNGAKGIVLNKISAHKFSHIIKSINSTIDENTINLGEQEVCIVLGGPVNSNNLFVVHSKDYKTNDTKKVNNSLYMTNQLNVIEDISQNKGPKNSIISIGCATWTKNQLEYELLGNSWFIANAEKSSIFEIPPLNLYDELFKQIGFSKEENNPALFLMNSYKC